ncbi:MAG: potassium channel family protein [Motilibacteraceae bacterium]
MSVVLPLVGALVVLAVAQDVFSTVLFPASGHGVIRKPLSRAVWHVFAALAGRTHGERRRNLLAYAGPVQIVATIGVWFLLLVVGWACIYQPALGSAITASKGPTDTAFATALYVSGYAVTTLGTGDVVAQTGAYRLLMVVEAACGFITFTMVISYFLSVYSQLPRRNAFAQALHDKSGGTDDAASLITALAEGEDLGRLVQELTEMASFLRHTAQTHRSYPVLRSFHYRQEFYALPQVLLTCLNIATLLRSTLDEHRYAAARPSGPADEVLAAGRDLLQELAPSRGDQSPTDETDETDEVWRQDFDEAYRRISAAGLVLRNEDCARREYAARRSDWDRPLRALGEAMLHEWREVSSRPAPASD